MVIWHWIYDESDVMKHMFVILSRNICLLFCHETCLLFVCVCWREKEGNVLFNDTLNTFYLRLYIICFETMSQMSRETHVCYLSVCVGGRRKEMFYLMTHSTHFIYGYMAFWWWNICLLFCHETYVCYFVTKHVCYLSVYVGWRRKEIFYLMTHSTHFIFGYMALDRCHETYVCYFVTKHMFVICLCMLEGGGRKCFI